ncbi:MAG: hypothetical protein QXG10_04870 [Candidatus Hadarchaeales archaeon]
MNILGKMGRKKITAHPHICHTTEMMPDSEGSGSVTTNSMHTVEYGRSISG